YIQFILSKKSLCRFFSTNNKAFLFNFFYWKLLQTLGFFNDLIFRLCFYFFLKKYKNFLSLLIKKKF
ncbi:hypothetical protein BWK60_01735, partial [Flavobacterium covae]